MTLRNAEKKVVLCSSVPYLKESSLRLLLMMSIEIMVPAPEHNGFNITTTPSVLADPQWHRVLQSLLSFPVTQAARILVEVLGYLMSLHLSE